MVGVIMYKLLKICYIVYRFTFKKVQIKVKFYDDSTIYPIGYLETNAKYNDKVKKVRYICNK